MKLLKNEKWKLEEITKSICVFTTIYCSVTIFIVGFMYALMEVSVIFEAILPVGFEEFSEGFINVLFSIFMFFHLLLYIGKIIYIFPIIITIFLISVAFTELVKRKNPRVFVHPLVLSSICTSFVWGFVVDNLIKNSF
ncbi:MAG: hypothetical protein IKK46_04705 [Clostridia bacterium]|nr:hypothetical protein [Clostridia bacterium]MBR3809587.1 hypothetical protein [Clostridia bacterium]